MKKISTVLFLALLPFLTLMAQDTPLRLAIAGVTHDHLAEVSSRVKRGDFSIVGVYEPNDAYRRRNALAGKVDENLFYSNLDQMLDETKPEAVAAYGPISEHVAVVEACAPRGIHVMVEKPLSTTVKDAMRIQTLAKKYGIKVITNYETTWYSTNWHARQIIESGEMGPILRMNIYDGHEGPKEIGCSAKFLEWLTDPVKNGGGAVVDFGCYGANIATWLLRGQEPETVFAVLHRHKPHIYPKVDDDATIVLQYPSATVQIMASWCWPQGRKDMDIYGMKGHIYQKNANQMQTYLNRKQSPLFDAPRLEAPLNDPFRFLRAVVRNEITMQPYDPSSLENNIMVVRILEAARKSAAKQCAVKF